MYNSWVMPLANPSLCESPVDAMADLLEGVYERAGKELEEVVEGGTFH
jgi:hypothetical protein